MQRFAKYTFTLLLGASIGFTSCDKGFEEMNTNPNASVKPNPDYLFSQSILKGNYVYDRAYFYTSYITVGNYVQHFANAKELAGAGSGDKYGMHDQYQSFYFKYIYTNVLTTLRELIKATEDPNLVNKKAAAQIWKVLIMQRITDLYGDVPYSDALKGASEGVFNPKYDAQSAIYDGMLKELDDAIKSFDNAKIKYGKADFFFDGDIPKWKKFGYSLMLRLAMRMTKVDANKAKEWALKAIQGGVILTAADQAVVKYTAGGQVYNNNPVAVELVSQDYAPNAYGLNNVELGKYSKTLIDFLQSKNDPRLPVVAVVWNGVVADTTATAQKGMANGTNGKPANFNTYSEPNPNTILQYAAPVIVLSAAETNFLLAEAVARGWTAGNAADYYKAGIEISMTNWGLFGAAGVIAPAKIAAYTTANALNTAGTLDAQLNQIHSQFWVASLLDEQEAYANWRRTGYPVLVPVNFPGNITGGKVPRRIPYPIAEQGINKKNYDDAVARQGADNLLTRIWWDKQ